MQKKHLLKKVRVQQQDLAEWEEGWKKQNREKAFGIGCGIIIAIPILFVLWIALTTDHRSRTNWEDWQDTSKRDAQIEAFNKFQRGEMLTDKEVKDLSGE